MKSCKQVISLKRQEILKYKVSCLFYLKNYKIMEVYMRNYDIVSLLAEETAKEVVRNGEHWKWYLTTASRLYKYPFWEQLLIYAQRPSATACASMDIWNKRMFCWVNRGAKGIAT